MTAETSVKETSFVHVGPIIAIVGPTAVGKSDLALRLAVDLGAVIVSVDSRQVYRYLDIGTAKPSRLERARVEHFMLDLIDPSETYTAQRFSVEGRRVLQAAAQRNRSVLAVGGTGFYLDALLDGSTFPEVAPDEQLRIRLRSIEAVEGRGALHRRLTEIDPMSAARIHPHNLPRIVRALEITEITGAPVAPTAIATPLQALRIGISAERTALHHIADIRVDQQIEAGLIEEAEALLAMGYDPSLPALDGLGYRQAIRVLGGGTSLHDAVNEYKIATHKYIRRQSTWFGRDSRIVWVERSVTMYSEVRDRVLRYLSTVS